MYANHLIHSTSWDLVGKMVTVMMVLMVMRIKVENTGRNEETGLEEEGSSYTILSRKKENTVYLETPHPAHHSLSRCPSPPAA